MERDRALTVKRLRLGIWGLAMLSAVLLAAACQSTPPVAKIGLIAPFEGLYRQSGYAALGAMRTALAETSTAPLEIVPLALDQSRDPARAARMLLADPQVRAIIGPLDPATAAAVLPVLAGSDVRWYAPYAVDPAGGFQSPGDGTDWAYGLLRAAATLAGELGATRLLLAGDPAGWPQDDLATWRAEVGMPVAFLPFPLPDAVPPFQPTDLIFWLGRPADGADFLNRLRSTEPIIPFVLGLHGDDPVFAARAASFSSVYWVSWVHVTYNIPAAQTHIAPSIDQTGLATRQALAFLADRPVDATQFQQEPWSVEIYGFDDGGGSRRIRVQPGVNSATEIRLP